ncbi:MAG TPA: maleylpyruvate isomerase N-terminal domain-containing protein, partial [Anaerolineales bacterium]|nr:maleylpyruvate isomerase N-terminal domain-containing protein [Anaerolineales bacterium]
MTSHVDARRRELLALLENTRHETRSLLSGLDPEQVVHTDARAWRVRDVVGHLAVWNAEAARSLEAHAKGGEYHCV